MTDVVQPLVLDLLEWIGPVERPYAEVMDAWRTSCPRLPVWETANEQGFLTRSHVDGRATVRVSDQGRRHLERNRRQTAA